MALTDTRDVHEALQDLIDLIEKAGLQNLTNGVQLGPTAWYVKMSDAVDHAKRVLAAPAQEAEGPTELLQRTIAELRKITHSKHEDSELVKALRLLELHDLGLGARAFRDRVLPQYAAQPYVQGADAELLDWLSRQRVTVVGHTRKVDFDGWPDSGDEPWDLRAAINAARKKEGV